MDNRDILFQVIYALAASGGRNKVLFGDSLPQALEAFEHSLPTTAFPELWFEIPLTGEPWFDFHALASAERLTPDTTLDPKRCGYNPEVFAWFYAREDDVRQLALSWDTGRGDVTHPAVQLLVNTDDPSVTCGFLEAAARPDLCAPYRTFVKAKPKSWFNCYTGIFGGRPGRFLRAECIPDIERCRTYAANPALIAHDLAQVGIVGLATEELAHLQAMVATPFQFEFQFDVDEHGRAGTTFAASVRFAQPDTDGAPYEEDGAAGDLMRRVEEAGLADERWHQLAATGFAKRIERGSESHLLYSYPAFLKIRWRDGRPLDAKAYLIAGVQ